MTVNSLYLLAFSEGERMFILIVKESSILFATSKCMSILSMFCLIRKPIIKQIERLKKKNTSKI